MLCSGYNKLRLLVNAVEIKVGDRSTVIKSTNILLLVKLVIITHNGGFHGALLWPEMTPTPGTERLLINTIQC